MSKPPWNYIGTGRVTIRNPFTDLLEIVCYYIRNDIPIAYAVADSNGYIYLGDKTRAADRHNAIRDALMELLRRQKTTNTHLTIVHIRGLTSRNEVAEQAAAE